MHSCAPSVVLVSEIKQYCVHKGSMNRIVSTCKPPINDNYSLPCVIVLNNVQRRRYVAKTSYVESQCNSLCAGNVKIKVLVGGMIGRKSKTKLPSAKS